MRFCRVNIDDLRHGLKLVQLVAICKRCLEKMTLRNERPSRTCRVDGHLTPSERAVMFARWGRRDGRWAEICTRFEESRCSVGSSAPSVASTFAFVILAGFAHQEVGQQARVLAGNPPALATERTIVPRSGKSRLFCALDGANLRLRPRFRY